MAKASIDFMAIGAHPDDIELGCGGTLLRLAAQGKTGVVVDLTDAAMGTRGTPEIRSQEAKAAAKLLKVKRFNLGLPDGKLENNFAAQKKLIALIREFKPKVLITHHWQEEHPDHEATAQIVKQACYKSGLVKLECEGEAFRPGRIFHFIGNELHEPTFCVDISEYYEKKLLLIRMYKSQFFNPDVKKFSGKTDLSTPAFLEVLEARNRYFGIRIKRRYAEAFVCAELPEVNDITALGGSRFS